MSLILFIVVILFIRGMWNSYLAGREIKGRQVRQCSVCGSVIPYGASKCPYCHSRPGTDLKADVDTFGDRFALFWGNVFRFILFSIVVLIILSML